MEVFFTVAEFKWNLNGMSRTFSKDLAMNVNYNLSPVPPNSGVHSNGSLQEQNI